MQKDAFFAMAVGPAQASHRDTGVFASVTLAQAIVESGWGDAHMDDAWNFFGIKAQAGEPFVVKQTREVVNGQNVFIDARFRKFESMEDCFRAHGMFLRDNSRYGPAFQTKDGESFAREIAKAGYATDPHYADALIEIMRENNLSQYDVASGGSSPVPAKTKPAAPGPPKQLDMRGIQQTLKRQGFDPGTIDGQFGPNTKKAVIAFQRAHKLEVDGVIGPNTMRALVAAAS